MYDDIKTCVSNNNEVSQLFPSYCGVRQGENISPILFALFLNDLESFLLGNENNGIEIRRKTIIHRQHRQMGPRLGKPYDIVRNNSF